MIQPLLFSQQELLPAVMAVPVDLFDGPVDIGSIRDQFVCAVSIWSTDKSGSWYLEPGEYGFWSRILECGKSYLMGKGCSMPHFLASYSSSLNKWQKLAYQWVLQNQNKILYVETSSHKWRIYQRGEYVEFALPYHSKGGEKNYVTRDGIKKILVNVD